MNQRIKTYLTAAFSAAALLFSHSCKDGDSVRIKGEMEGAPDKTVTVERADYNGGWTFLDSIRTDDKGRYTLEVAAPGAPEIYRLAIEGQHIYFPVTGSETLTVSAKAPDFSNEYTISGTPDAEKMERFDKEASRLPFDTDPDSVARFKRKLYTEVIQNGRGDILSYYFITRQVDGRFLFNPEDKKDARFIAAVGTAYAQFNPDDPHAKLLENMGLQAMRMHTSGKTVEAQEVGYFDITLPGKDGTMQSLSQLVGKGKPVVLAFTSLTLEGAPEYNKELFAVYNSGKAEIYQICYDADPHLWAEAAANLPWTVVYDQKGSASDVLSQYNVGSLPSVFLIDGSGQLVDRAVTPQSFKL